MRGNDQRYTALFCRILPGEPVPADRPLAPDPLHGGPSVKGNDSIWAVTVRKSNRARPLEGEAAVACRAQVLARARSKAFWSDARCSADGASIGAWAENKSLPRENGQPAPPADDPGDPEVKFPSENRKNGIH